MTEFDDRGRPVAPPDGNEAAILLGFLEHERATLAWKTDGLDADGMRFRTAASSMTLGGMLKHLSFVEDYWFTYWLHGESPQPEFAERDWESEPDWDWTSAEQETPEQLRERWRGYVTRARTQIERALAVDGVNTPAQKSEPDGRKPTLRWMLVHMIQEYARHNGHADLLREAIDGETGE